MTRSRRAEAGQHFLASAGAASRVVDAARIGAGDTVYEAGTGTGALVPLLCGAARRVISVESDARLHAEALDRLGGLPGLELRHADAFSSDEAFDVFVSSLPYSQSRRAFEWMARRATLDRATVAAINSLFSYRRKTLRSALRLLGAGGSGGTERVGDLGVGEIVRVARSISR